MISHSLSVWQITDSETITTTSTTAPEQTIEEATEETTTDDDTTTPLPVRVRAQHLQESPTTVDQTGRDFY